MSDLILQIGGTNYAGWETANINKAIDKMTGAFGFKVSEKWRKRNETWRINPGDEAKIKIDDDVLIQGYIDKRNVLQNPTQHNVSFEGRDSTSDLVDCSIATAPWNWENITITELVRNVAKPFGITNVVNLSGNTKKISKAKVQVGESPAKFLERYQKQLGVLVRSDGVGGIIIDQPAQTRTRTVLKEGENVKFYSGSQSWANRFSEYIVKGQGNGFDELTPEFAAFAEGKATDEEIAESRYRPKIIISENAVNSGTAKDRAAWEASTRKGRSQPISVTVRGWRQSPGGDLWRENLVVPVDIPGLKLKGDMLIRNINYVLSPGEVANMTLVSPDIYQLQPDLKKSNGNWGALVKRVSRP